MRLVRLLVICCLFSATTAMAAEYGGVTELYVTPTVSYYHWDERDSGQLLLREQGPLLGLGGGVRAVLVRTDSGQSLNLSGRADLFGGWTYYDGHVQKTNVPVTTTVTYFGGHAGCDLGWSFPWSGSTVGPIAGLDYRIWLRDLQNSTASDGTAVSGYSEVWQSLATRLGLHWDGPRSGSGWTLFAEGGALYPFYATNQVEVAGSGTITIRPEGEWSAFAGIGIRNERLRMAVTYEGLRFGRSPVVAVSPTKGYFQPESSGDSIGISVGYCFQ